MRYSIRTLLFLVAVAAIGFALMEVIERLHRVAARESQVQLRLQLAVLGLQASENRWPWWRLNDLSDSDGSVLCSWRYLTGHNISPFAASADWKVPWNRPSNRTNAAAPFFPFCITTPTNAAIRQSDTVVLAIKGPGAAFDPADPHRLSELDADTIVLIEAANSGVHWMEPTDYDVTRLSEGRGTLGDCIRGHLPDRVYVAFADGNVWRLAEETPMKALTPFLTVKGARRHSRDETLEAFRLGDAIEMDIQELNEYR